MASVTFALLFIAVIAFCTWWLMKYSRMRQMLEKMPGPRHYLGIGNIYQFKPNADDWFEQTHGLCNKYGSPHRITRIWLLWKPYIVVYGADECEVILSSNRHINKSREYKHLEPWMGLGLLTSYAEKWRPRRKLLTPTFHYDILKDFVYVYNQQTKILLGKFEKKLSENTKSFDVYPLMTRCALDIICESAMGRHVNAQQNRYSDYVVAIYKLNQIIHERQKQPWFWPDVTFNAFGRGKEHQWCLDVIHGFTKKVIRERMDGRGENGTSNGHSANDETIRPKKRLAFLDLLIDMERKGELNFQDVCDEVNTFMFEGHDTTSSGMSWTLFLLGCYPEIQAKVQLELDHVFGDDSRDITFEDLKHLSYLECCVKESLRLFPTVPMYIRKLECDVDFVGYTVPQETQVLVFPFAVHRDPKHWPDPEKFDPDRFLPDNSNGRHPYAYLPFSAGARNCIGQRFAIMEEKTVLAWILRYFSVKSVHRRDQIRPKGEVILRSSVGFHLELTMRRKPIFDDA